MMKKILTFFLFIPLCFGLKAQQSPGKDHSMLNINCKTCHTCDVPTKSDPCLVICPRNKIATVYQKPEETPGLIVIDQLSERYGPVYFSHRIHAQMSIMSGGCANCHHHNTSGPILECNSCHKSSRKREDVSLPDLRGAFHRQCMDCHREWSHETGCDNTCHTLKKDVNASKSENLQKKYAGKDHPVVLKPDKIVFETNYEKGKLVTFYHIDHTKKFGIKCATCHKQESCTKCHDMNKNTNTSIKTIKEVKTLEEHHNKCFGCHKNDECSTCHLTKTADSFDHDKRTGWALNRFHIKLSCVKCHGEEIPYQKLDNKCTSCHQNWSNTTFKHSVTGLQLSETHSDFKCEDCHSENNFAIAPNCDGCHDGYIYPKQKPGKLIDK
jgi:hypothetical protein